MLLKKNPFTITIKQKHITFMYMLLIKKKKYSFLKSYGNFKMCFTCATYTDLSFLITDEIPRV